jgi:ribose 5-phosphate isomerase A
MDLKKEVARMAFALVNNQSSVGLGDGVTIRWLADHMIEGIRNGLSIRLFTSSTTTENYLQEAGISVLDISVAKELDQYFDGCDQVDHDLNAFKSGAGIHTTEKLLASMAKQFILLADDSKFVLKLENKFPLVLEVIPPAVSFVSELMKSFFPGLSLSVRLSDGTNQPVITRYGNLLIDCRFPELPPLSILQNYCKNITGVVDISLFYQIASNAIIAGHQRTRSFERKNNRVTLITGD